MQRIEKPWGYEIIWAKTDRYVGKILHINSGQRLSLQYHCLKEETIMVLRGELTLKIGKNSEKEMKLGPWEVYHIIPGVIHRMEARNGEVEVMEVSTPELEDVIRIEDDYNRCPN